MVAVGAITVLLAAQSARGWLLAPLRALYSRLLSPGLEDAPTGPLPAEPLGTLLLATRALAGVPVRLAHYEEFFRWRAENLRGHKALYEQFAAALDRRTRRLVRCDFVDCSRQMQQKMLEELRDSGSPATASLVTDPAAQRVLWRCRTDAAGLATRRPRTVLRVAGLLGHRGFHRRSGDDECVSRPRPVSVSNCRAEPSRVTSDELELISSPRSLGICATPGSLERYEVPLDESSPRT